MPPASLSQDRNAIRTPLERNAGSHRRCNAFLTPKKTPIPQPRMG